MHKLSSRQWLVLVLLTIVWGINWPIMKAGVTGFPPLTFRAIDASLSGEEPSLSGIPGRGRSVGPEEGKV